MYIFRKYSQTETSADNFLLDILIVLDLFFKKFLGYDDNQRGMVECLSITVSCVKPVLQQSEAVYLGFGTLNGLRNWTSTFKRPLKVNEILILESL